MEGLSIIGAGAPRVERRPSRGPGRRSVGRYILKRLGLSLITLVIVSFTVFAAA